MVRDPEATPTDVPALATKVEPASNGTNGALRRSSSEGTVEAAPSPAAAAHCLRRDALPLTSNCECVNRFSISGGGQTCILLLFSAHVVPSRKTIDRTRRDMATLVAGGEPADHDGADALAAQVGDRDAFVRLVRRHEQVLAAHLLRFTHNETVLQDLREETYLEAYRSLSTYKHQGPFFKWLRQIASRVGYRYWARQAKEAQAKTAYLELQRYCASAQSTRHAQDAIECVAELLACLDRCDRTLLEMKYVQGLKATEIAQSTGWSAGRVRVRLHRTLKKLRNLDSGKHGT